MANYKIELKVISPIHIGTGEVYEPINYVIDKEDTKNYMYIFDEFEFYNSLDLQSKAEFNQIANDEKDGLRRLQNFIFRQKELCKKISNRKILITSNVAKDYNDKIGKIVQVERSGKRINQLTIEKTYISPNINKAIISGSSIKGAIRTAFGEYELKKDKSLQNIANNKDKLLEIEKRLKKYFGDILVSDSSIATLSSTFVDDAVNYKRTKETKENEEGIKVRYEAITPGCKFEINLNIKNENFKQKDLAKICNDHYMPIFKSQFSEETDKFAKENLSSKFIEKYENLKLQDNQFLLRIGKHSSARAVTIDGIREIKIMKGKNKKPTYEKEETTVWHIDKKPFGWLLCEIVE